MPLREYRCEDCDKRFDYLMSSMDTKPTEPCKACGSENLVKQLSYPATYEIKGDNSASTRPKKMGGRK